MRKARWSEGLPDWIGVHVGALAAIGGVPKAVVCDNLKAGVTKASRYEPGVNRTYQDLATHYGFAILPTRVRKPRDKAKVEVAVQIVQRFVLARLRNRRFFSLADLNIAIRECVADLNAKIMRKLGKSRRELLETIERPALKALPTEPYRYAEWKRCPCRPRLPRRDCQATSTPSPRASSVKWSRRASPTRPSRFSIAARALPAMRSLPCGTGTPRSQSTCRVRTGVTPSGRPHA